MKKTIRVIKGILGLSVFLFIFIFIPSVVGAIETHYSRYGIISEVGTIETLIEDKQGNIWAIYNDSDNQFMVGDEVKMIMFTNYTDNKIKDDIIVKIKKIK